LANSKFAILPHNFHNIKEEDFFKKPIGVGPYKFESWEGNQLSLVVNENYFLKRAPIGKFVFTTMEKKEALKAFEKHEVDDLVAYKITPADIKRKDVSAFKWNTYNTHFLFFNVKKPPLDNMYLRLAIRAAVDRKKLIEKCYPDDELATGVVSTGLIGAINNQNAFSDLNKSVDYFLLKAGITREQLPPITIIRLIEMKDDCFKPTVEKMFKAARLPIKVEFVSFAEAVRQQEENENYIISEWLSIRNVEPINIMNFFDGRSSLNLSKVNDKEINNLIDLAEISRTRSARGEIYRQISELIIRRAYAMEIQFENRYYVYDKDVKDVNIIGPARHFMGLRNLSFN